MTTDGLIDPYKDGNAAKADAAECRLQAAIAELKSLRAHSPFGSNLCAVKATTILYGIENVPPEPREVAPGLWTEDPDEAALIVALHRTMDAQEEMLLATLKSVRHNRGASSYLGPGFTLADAILGSTS